MEPRPTIQNQERLKFHAPVALIIHDNSSRAIIHPSLQLNPEYPPGSSRHSVSIYSRDGYLSGAVLHPNPPLADQRSDRIPSSHLSGLRKSLRWKANGHKPLVPLYKVNMQGAGVTSIVNEDTDPRLRWLE